MIIVILFSGFIRRNSVNISGITSFLNVNLVFCLNCHKLFIVSKLMESEFQYTRKINIRVISDSEQRGLVYCPFFLEIIY